MYDYDLLAEWQTGPVGLFNSFYINYYNSLT
jgi:hypothetical protein